MKDYVYAYYQGCERVFGEIVLKDGKPTFVPRKKPADIEFFEDLLFQKSTAFKLPQLMERVLKSPPILKDRLEKAYRAWLARIGAFMYGEEPPEYERPRLKRKITENSAVLSVMMSDDFTDNLAEFIALVGLASNVAEEIGAYGFSLAGPGFSISIPLRDEDNPFSLAVYGWAIVEIAREHGLPAAFGLGAGYTLLLRKGLPFSAAHVSVPILAQVARGEILGILDPKSFPLWEFSELG